jgi:hypothetical protein
MDYLQSPLKPAQDLLRSVSKGRLLQEVGIKLPSNSPTLLSDSEIHLDQLYDTPLVHLIRKVETSVVLTDSWRLDNWARTFSRICIRGERSEDPG